MRGIRTLADFALVGIMTSCMNSRLQSTQEFWYAKMGIDRKMNGPWYFG